MADTFNDMMGNPIVTGDFVLASDGDYNLLFIFKVIGWTPKYVRLKRVGKNGYDMKRTKDSAKFLKMKEEDVTLYLLKNTK